MAHEMSLILIALLSVGAEINVEHDVRILFKFLHRVVHRRANLTVDLFILPSLTLLRRELIDHFFRLA